MAADSVLSYKPRFAIKGGMMAIFIFRYTFENINNNNQGMQK
jgi:hypothetical protein